ncbi:hypothetical protein GCM10009676_14870 [Prauserella halophila]|uniref:Secreted protein n=1 Tax=Prauserella halophila TaxID=185641 RepID=A0ABN1W2N4_9PSEU
MTVGSFVGSGVVVGLLRLVVCSGSVVDGGASGMVVGRVGCSGSTVTVVVRGPAGRDDDLRSTPGERGSGLLTVALVVAGGAGLEEICPSAWPGRAESVASLDDASTPSVVSTASATPAAGKARQ